jgi:hypothetical protein
MTIYGIDYFARISREDHFTAKLVFNRAAAYFFPATQEHRDAKAEGLSYEDDYKGNALAAMVLSGLIEIRYHASFTAGEVAECLRLLSMSRGLEDLQSWRATYRGQPVPGWEGKSGTPGGDRTHNL